MRPFDHCGAGCTEATMKMFSAQRQTMNTVAATRTLRQALQNGADENTYLPKMGMTVGQLCLILNLSK